METKNIVWVAVALVTVLGFMFIGTRVGATEVTPSTNDDNKAVEWAYVEQLNQNVGSTDLQFISTRGFDSCFEYRTDGDTSQAINEEHELEIYGVVPQGELQEYPHSCQNNNSSVHTIYADEYVEVRMMFGAEGDERFDWTRFDVLPAPEISIGDGDVGTQDTNCADLDALTEEQALGDCGVSKVEPVVKTSSVAAQKPQEVQIVKEELVVFPTTGGFLWF